MRYLGYIGYELGFAILTSRTVNDTKMLVPTLEFGARKQFI